MINVKKIISAFFLLFLICFPVFAYTSPDIIKDLPNNTKVQTQGVVVSEPGKLGKQIFYINGIQIYSYYKDFPKLKIKDEILVNGVVSQYRNEKRIKIKSKNDIKVLKHNVIVNPLEIQISDINTKLVGKLIKINGIVIERTGLKIFVDQNRKEIVVYIKEYANIDKSIINEGDNISVVGILSQSNNELRVLPRNNQDINILNGRKISINDNTDNITLNILASTSNVIDFYKFKHYFILISIILGIIFILLLIKLKKNSN